MKMDQKTKIEELKKKIVLNPIVVEIKEKLKKKLLKKQHKEFKQNVSNFLANPTLNLTKLSIKKLKFQDNVKMINNLLLTNKEFEQRIKILIQNQLYYIEEQENQFFGDKQNKAYPLEADDDDEDTVDPLIQNKYGNVEEQDQQGAVSKLTKKKTLNVQNKFNKIIEQLKDDIEQDFEAILINKAKENIQRGHFLLKFIQNFKNPKKDFLQKFSTNDFKTLPIEEIKNELQELDNEKYEHIEQSKECEEVELERIEEVENILSDDDKKNEEQEYLSFSKAGIPDSKRIAFQRGYYQIVLKDIKSQNRKDYFKDDYLSAVDKRIGELILNSLNYHEYFVYEKSMKNLFTYFLKNYSKLNQSTSDKYLGYYPFPGIESFIVLSAALSQEFQESKRFLKIIHQQIYKKLYTFEHENTENIFSLCSFFENRFMQQYNELYVHLRTLGVWPVEYAIGWMGALFMGELLYDQILLLVDRIIGFETLYIMPIFILGIFKYFSEKLMECTSKEEVESVVYLPGLKTLKILNLYLFDDDDQQFDNEDEQ